MLAHLRRWLLPVVPALLGVLAGGSARADLGAVIGSYGNWQLRRAVDTMTGRPRCIATYTSNIGVQLNNDALYIRTSRAPRLFRYRIDGQPPTSMQRVPQIMQQLRAVDLEGTAFHDVVKARRLRLQVLSRRTMQEFDLDLNGIYSAYAAVYYCR